MPSGPDSDFLIEHTRLLLAAYERLLGEPLIGAGSALERATALYEAPFVVVSHDTAPDPVFNYANLAAQRLFELGWEAFTALPSRLSAGPVHREERSRLLERVSRLGYIDDYAGVRVTGSGRPFRIESAVVWNVADDCGVYIGQAATFASWHFV